MYVGSPPPAGGVPPDVAASAVLPTVRERLRAGRLDPGRRAVAGLAAVALLACLVAGGVVLRGRPQEVAAPVVEQAGTPITGGSSVGAAPAAAEVVVAVAGKVRRPGLVRLPPAAGSTTRSVRRAASPPAPPSGC